MRGGGEGRGGEGRGGERRGEERRRKGEGVDTLRRAMRCAVLCCVSPCLSVCFCVSLSTLFSCAVMRCAVLCCAACRARARARARAFACLVYHCHFSSKRCIFFTHQVGLEICKSAWNNFEKQKNMKPLWKVKGFAKRTSWKVRVPDWVSS